MPTEADEALKSRQLFIDIVSVTAVHKVLKRHLIKHNNNNNTDACMNNAIFGKEKFNDR